MKYFHLLKNPYYSLHYELEQEVFATCFIESNVVRVAVSSTYNTSITKINTIGGYQGLSTFTF